MDSGDNRTCPFCGEIIKRGAVVCRYCVRDVPVSDAPAPSTFAAAPKDHELPLNLQPSPKAPPTYKSYWYITVPITLLLLLAWRNRSSVAGYIHGDPGDPFSTSLTGSTLDSEANVEAMKYLDGISCKCGDKFYEWGTRWASPRPEEIIEMLKKPVLSNGDPNHINPPVSDVDRMNGLTWFGVLSVTSSTSRTLNQHETSPWNGAGNYHLISIKKLNGVWLFQRSDQWISVDSFSDKPSCEQVSEYLSQNSVSGTGSQ